MILQSLYKYYLLLLDDPEVDISVPGYSKAQVSHVLNLSKTGELLDIIPLYIPVQQGKKIVERPRLMNVPERLKRSVNITPNFLCDNATYVLGITGKDAKDPDYAARRFEAFQRFNVELLSRADTPIAQTVVTFLQKHDPQKAAETPVIFQHLEELKQASNLIFQVEGMEVLKDPKIRRVWEDYLFSKEATEMQCLVTGEREPIARLHPDIKGVLDAQAKGASLVSFNLDAFTSYGKVQGSNSPVSQRVASGYAVALNYLLSRENPNRKIFLGDTTVVYWTDSSDKRYASAFYSFINPEYLDESGITESSENGDTMKKLKAVAAKVEGVKPIDLQALRTGLDQETCIHVLGLAPSAARLSVRFFFSEPFGIFADRIMQHYEDLNIVKQFPNQTSFPSPYRILSECVSPKVTRREEELKSSWSLLGGALMRSILTGTPYPEGLYTAIMNRIRHDTDETDDKGRRRNTKINYVRAGFIKAYLLRKYRRLEKNPYQEVLQMSLNESNAQPAYVLGRLFAWLERAQVEASGNNINATIKDRYFTSACATPGSVFPILLKLSQHWNSKAEYGKFYDRKIEELLNKLEAKNIPARLSLDEQGVFVLGYYHQRANLYEKFSKMPTETEIKTNNLSGE